MKKKNRKSTKKTRTKKPEHEITINKQKTFFLSNIINELETSNM